MLKPSFFALSLSGILNLIALLFLIANFKYSKPNDVLLAIILFSISFSCHGLLHGHIETHYGWSPFEGSL
ncbi:MAG: hypothetical protein WD512_14545, partial [Candidatus Paceibacterota bacterium]